MIELLKNRNFIFLLSGRLVTNIGDSLYYIAAMWLVHDIGQSAFYTGLSGFLILSPKALQFLAGPLVDRWRIKTTLIVTQVVQSILILIIPLAYLLDFLSITLILSVMPLLACVEEFAYPTQTKALPLFLKEKELLQGNSLFAFAYQGVDLVFNSLAGLAIAFFGAITMFFVDSVTFALAAMFFSFLNMDFVKTPAPKTQHSLKLTFTDYIDDLKEGFSVVFTSLLWIFLIGSSVANFAIGMTVAVLPVFADQIGGVQTYGILLAAMSAGSLLGALLGSTLGKLRVGIVTSVCFLVGSICWILAGWLSSPLITPILFGIAWIPIGAVNVLFAGVTQTIIPNQILGRVNSVAYSLGIAAMPIGSLLGGYVATFVDPHFIFMFAGLGISLIACVWFFHPDLRKLPQVEQMTASTFKIS